MEYNIMEYIYKAYYKGALLRGTENAVHNVTQHEKKWYTMYAPSGCRGRSNAK